MPYLIAMAADGGSRTPTPSFAVCAALGLVSGAKLKLPPLTMIVLVLIAMTHADRWVSSGRAQLHFELREKLYSEHYS